MRPKNLKLIARTREDIRVVSAHLQDSIVNIADIANLKKNKYNEVLKIAKKAHLALGCRGVTRADFKFENNKFYLLEINTQPGMTDLSLVPEIANYCGISFKDLVEKILLDANINK